MQTTTFPISPYTGWRLVVPVLVQAGVLRTTQANVELMLALDLKYFEEHLEPVAKWGEQEPHE